MGEQYSGIGATYDSMTGLMDRMTFFGDVNEYRKRRVQCHIVLVQLSRLMQVNRKYGITVGDQLIRDISMWLAELDEAYKVYRIANSRLMLLGPACSRQQAEACVNRIHSRFGENWQVACEGQEHTVLAKTYLIHLFGPGRYGE